MSKESICVVDGSSPSQSLHQIRNPTAQGVRKDLEGLEGNVTLSAFDFANVCPVQASLVGEQILGPPLRVP